MAVKKRSFDESEVLKNLNKEIIKIKGRTKKGITKALTEIMALSKERTPVDAHGDNLPDAGPPRPRPLGQCPKHRRALAVDDPCASGPSA